MPMVEFLISNKMTTNRSLLRLVSLNVQLLAILLPEQSILTSVFATTSSGMVESSLLETAIAALLVLVIKTRSAVQAID